MNSPTVNSTFDWSATAAWIALAIAIISPIITSIINNKHATKIKKMDFDFSTRSKMISEYVEITSREILKSGVSDDYRKIFSQIFLYVPKSTWNDIEKLNSLMLNGKESSKIFADKNECTAMLINICKKLNFR